MWSDGDLEGVSCEVVLPDDAGALRLAPILGEGGAWIKILQHLSAALNGARGPS
jgi:hypothetical protein